MDTTHPSSSAPAAALAALPARRSAGLPDLRRTAAAPPLHPAETLLLPRGQAVTLAEGACVLRVEAGRIWLTRSGDPDDHFLAAGERFEHNGDDVVVIECDSATAARLSVAVRTPG